jgi:hypothetical protein
MTHMIRHIILQLALMPALLAGAQQANETPGAAQVNPPVSGSGDPSQATQDSAATAEAPATAAIVPPAAPAIEIPLFQKPYRVIVTVGFDGLETSSPVLRQQLVNDIRMGIARMYGAMWDVQVSASDWMIPADTHRLQRLTEADLIDRYPETAAEKVILISIMGDFGLFEVSSREFDSRVQELSPLLTRQTYDVQSVSNLACQLTRDCFRPVLLLSKPTVDGKSLEFHLQAGAFVPPDPSAAQIADGDVLRTFMRQLDRRNPGKIKFRQKLDLCYIRVTSFNRILSTAIGPEDQDVSIEGAPPPIESEFIDRGHVQGVLIAHGPVPFGGKGRNLQQIGLRQRPAAEKSRVRMVLKARPDRPLICYRVDRVSKLLQTETSDIPNVRLLTDRNGEVEIAVDPKNPTYWLYVYSGSMLLARVPYAPGLIPQDVMLLPDDSIRLAVEGELYLLRDELVDMVAQKAVYVSIAKKAAAAGDKAGVEAALANLEALPGQQHFELELNRIRAPAVQKADAQKNAAGKRRVESLCTKMGESLTAFFSTEKRIRDAEELRQLRESVGATATQ